MTGSTRKEWLVPPPPPGDLCVDGGDESDVDGVDITRLDVDDRSDAGSGDGLVACFE